MAPTGIRQQLLRIAAVFGALLTLSACGLSYDLDCGPMGRTACLDEADAIIEAMARYHSGESVSSIEFFDEEGHALVMLDDGTEIGWGERQQASD